MTHLNKQRDGVSDKVTMLQVTVNINAVVRGRVENGRGLGTVEERKKMSLALQGW